MEKQKIYKISIILALMFISISFQNCSDVNFEADLTQYGAEISLFTDENDGAQYTNNKVVDLKFEFDKSLYTSLKVSLDKDFINAVDYETQDAIKFDLGDSYAADGSKDGLKKIYINLATNVNMMFI